MRTTRLTKRVTVAATAALALTMGWQTIASAVPAGAAKASTVARVAVTPTVTPLENIAIGQWMHARAQGIYDCMITRGITNIPRPIPAAEATAIITGSQERRYGVSTTGAARLYGYHAPWIIDYRPGQTIEAPTGQLAENAMYGTGEFSGLGSCIQIGDSRAGSLPGGGDTANSRVPLPLTATSFAAAQKSPAVTKAQSSWSGCMASHGYRYETTFDAAADPRWSQTSTPTAAEIATATQDAACQRAASLGSVFYGAENRVISQTVSEGESPLDLPPPPPGRGYWCGDYGIGQSPQQLETCRYIGNDTNHPADTGCHLDSYCFWYNYIGDTFPHYKTGVCSQADMAVDLFSTTFPWTFGSGEVVKNNSHTAADGTYYPLFIYYGENFTGPTDWLDTGTMGTEWFTLNDNASYFSPCDG